MMRYIASDIKNSIFQDIYDRLDESNFLDDVEITEGGRLSFKYKKNSIIGIGFKKSSGDQKSKLKSLAGFNCVLVEEADETGEDDFMQLDDSLRTAKSDILVILQLNPPDKNHWIIRRWFNLVDVGIPGFYQAVQKESTKHNTVVIQTTYRQNIANLNPSSVQNYEAYRESRPDYYWNMIRGLISEGKRGRIFKHWKPMSVADFEALPYQSVYGLDFGFHPDPAALIEIKYHNRTVWARQLIYKTGLTNPRLAAEFERLELDPNVPIYADSQENKSIQELQDLGWNVLPADKGPGSVNARYDFFQSAEVYYTEDSVVEGEKGPMGLAIEVQDHCWKLDRNKEPTGVPEDKNNHAIDALHYGVMTDRNQGYIGF
jgi:phage terminase large subunit